MKTTFDCPEIVIRQVNAQFRGLCSTAIALALASYPNTNLLVTIGVYRIYIGCTWADPSSVARLTSVLDSVPGFLYRLDRLGPDALARRGEANDARAAIRIAMTQSHACLVLADTVQSMGSHLEIELDLARNGFRRNIPVVLVTKDGLQGSDLDHVCTDIVTNWQPASLACSIQQVAEEAAADWRSRNRKRVDASAGPSEPEPFAAAVSGHPAQADRQLPMNEILHAYEQQKLLRGRSPRSQS